MDVEISFQKTRTFTPYLNWYTYYIQQVHSISSTGGLKPYGKKNHHMIRTKVWEPKKLTAYSSSYSAIHNGRVDIYVCAGSNRYSFGIGRYIGLADMGKALSISVSADNLVHIGSFTDIEFIIEKMIFIDFYKS